MSNAVRLANSFCEQVYDSSLELNSFYSLLLAAFKRGLFVICCIEQKLSSVDLELEPQETDELKLQKTTELESLKECLSLCGRLITLHRGFSREFIEDIFSNLFQKAVSDPQLNVDHASTEHRRVQYF